MLTSRNTCAFALPAYLHLAAQVCVWKSSWSAGQEHSERGKLAAATAALGRTGVAWCLAFVGAVGCSSKGVWVCRSEC